jgi:hypothetical protein
MSVEAGMNDWMSTKALANQLSANTLEKWRSMKIGPIFTDS